MKSKEEKKRRETEKEQKKEDTGARKSEERNTLPRNAKENRYSLCFPMICGLGGSKSRLNAARAETCRQRRNENLHPAVAVCAFSGQNQQNTPASEHF